MLPLKAGLACASQQYSQYEPEQSDKHQTDERGLLNLTFSGLNDQSQGLEQTVKSRNNCHAVDSSALAPACQTREIGQQQRQSHTEDWQVVIVGVWADQQRGDGCKAHGPARRKAAVDREGDNRYSDCGNDD